MSNDIKEYYSENPEKDIWDLLLNFTYEENIKTYLKEKRNVNDEEKLDKLSNIISGSLEQAKEYFESSNTVSLFTSPLLLYYGLVNLMYGTAHLLTGDFLKIDNHGLNLNLKPEEIYKGKIGDITLNIQNHTKGSFYNFLSIFDNFKLENKINDWTLKEIFGSIPEIKEDFENCYKNDKSFTFPIEKIIRKDISFERIREEEVKRLGESFFSDIYKFSENYLRPQKSSNNYILHKKLNAKGYYLETISGIDFLSLVHKKDTKSYHFSILLLMELGLFGLGSLSRYHPGVWNKFIKNDKYGERLIVEKFLKICRRYVPNIVLNKVLNKKIKFTYYKRGTVDETNIFHKEDILNIVKNHLKEITPFQ